MFRRTLVQIAERIGALDVLRGIALLGMFLVHFHYYVNGPGDSPRLSSVYDWIATNLLEERFWTMFGILFGAGFAVQLRRAEIWKPLATRRRIDAAIRALLVHHDKRTDIHKSVLGRADLPAIAAKGLDDGVSDSPLR